jgi:lysophospholipase L1-like esterase
VTYGKQKVRYTDLDIEEEFSGKGSLILGCALQVKTETQVAASGSVFAIDQNYTEGVEETTNAGFTGRAYLNLDNKVGSSVEWRINVPEEGNYLCTFRHANGTTVDRKMKVRVNGGTDVWMQSFSGTGAWTQWKERSIVLPLRKGINAVAMTSVTSDGGPYVDFLSYEWTVEPVPEPYVEPSPSPTEKPDPTKSLTIWIAGDSTVQTYSSRYAPQQGWGAHLADFIPSNNRVNNHAMAGRSSKSFVEEGRLQTILDQIQPGDYLLVQFGINDSASTKTERYAPPCGTIPGTAGSYEYYMEQFIKGALDRGAKPIIVTTVIGLKATTVEYTRAERYAGESKYPLKKMLSLAWNGVTSFSVKPIRAVFSLGVVFSCVSLVVLIYAVIVKMLGQTVDGWTFTICSIWLIGGIQTASIGLIGEYVGKTYIESKHRPRYAIEKIHNPYKKL